MDVRIWRVRDGATTYSLLLECPLMTQSGHSKGVN